MTVNLSVAGAQTINSNLTLTLSANNTVDNVVGSALADNLTGNVLNNILTGGAGNDRYVFDSDGALGSDEINELGGGGVDTLDFSLTTTRGVTVNLSSTLAQAVNANLNLTLSAGNALELAIGGAHDDRLIGNALNNTLNGGAGNDVLVGAAGGDTLQGGTGLDLLIGGVSVDTLFGNAGEDILIGGTTSHDASLAASLAALNAIMAEWTRALPYLERIDHLTNTTPGGNNGTFFLKAAGGNPPGATVFNDAVADGPTGGTELDWFFISGGDSSDQVVGTETRTDIA